MKETELGLLIPEDADSPDGPTQIGGNAEKGDALHQTGGVGGHFWNKGNLTRKSETFGSYSTPVKVTIPRVLANQLIDIYLTGWVSGQAAAVTMRIMVAGQTVFRPRPLVEITTLALTDATGQGHQIGTAVEGLVAGAEEENSSFAARIAKMEGDPVAMPAPITVKNENAEVKPLTVELEAKAASGKTASIEGAYLVAVARG